MAWHFDQVIVDATGQPVPGAPHCNVAMSDSLGGRFAFIVVHPEQ
jgi:hypothetical protein